ncbi:MAG: META domain-containing protein [Verrucomicrobiota bacterium]
MNLKLLPLTALVPAALILLSGCATGSNPGSPATAESLARWENKDLKCVNLVVQGTPVSLPVDAGITLRITGPGKVAGSSAVNRYFGGYTLGPAGAIHWTPFGSTRMAGPPERMQLEDQFLKALESTTRADVTPHGIVLQTSDASTRVEFSH